MKKCAKCGIDEKNAPEYCWITPGGTLQWHVWPDQEPPKADEKCKECEPKPFGIIQIDIDGNCIKCGRDVVPRNADERPLEIIIDNSPRKKLMSLLGAMGCDNAKPWVDELVSESARRERDSIIEKLDDMAFDASDDRNGQLINWDKAKALLSDNE